MIDVKLCFINFSAMKYKILIIATSKELAITHTHYLIACLQVLQFTINKEKPSLTHSQLVNYLGFQINFKDDVIKLHIAKSKT